MSSKVSNITRFAVYGVMRPAGAVLSTLHGLGHHRGRSPGDDQVRVIRDLSYGDRSAAQAVDVYLPRNAAPDKPLPTVFFLHGGAWVMCNRSVSATIGRMLAARGYAVVTPGYRLLPDCSPEEQAADIAAAFEKTRALARQELPLDLDRLFVVGESAGAHLTARLLQTYPKDATPPRAWVGIFGVYDLPAMKSVDKLMYLPLVDSLVQGRDKDEVLDRHNALRELPWNDLPVLLVHGTNDTVVSVQQSKSMARLLEQQGVPVTLDLHEDVGHGFIYDQRSPAREQGQQALQTMIDFIGQHDLPSTSRGRVKNTDSIAAGEAKD